MVRATSTGEDIDGQLRWEPHSISPLKDTWKKLSEMDLYLEAGPMRTLFWFELSYIVEQFMSKSQLDVIFQAMTHLEKLPHQSDGTSRCTRIRLL